MEKPCLTCLVSPCCTERCRDYATYVYFIKRYEQAGDLVIRQIDEMEEKDAIEHILMVENVYLRVLKIREEKMPL